MSGLIDFINPLFQEVQQLRAMVQYLSQMDHYDGTIALGGNTLTVTANTTLSGTPAAASHTHAGADITSGTVAAVRLGSGTTTSATFLHGNSVWATLWEGDIPPLDASRIASGTFPAIRLGSGSATAVTTLHGDSTYSLVDLAAETTGTLTISRGGTGAITAAAALAALGGAATGHAHAAADITSGTLLIARGGTGVTTGITEPDYLNVGTAAGAATGQIATSGDVGIGVNVSAGTRAYIKGAGTTSATFGLIVHNSAATQLFAVRNDNTLFLGGTGATLQFFGSGGNTKPTVTGSRGANAALASLLTALASMGMLTDSSTA